MHQIDHYDDFINAHIVKILKFSKNGRLSHLWTFYKKTIFITFNFRKSMHLDMFRLFIKLTIITIFKIADIVKNLKIYRNEHLSHLWSFFEKKTF